MTERTVRNVAEDKDPQLVARRHSQLIQAAIAVFSRVGFHAATVKDVADAAGVSAGLIYQYVSDKQDLLFLCLTHIVERNKEEIPAAIKDVKDPMKRLYMAVDAFSRVIAANPSAVQLTYRESKSLKRQDIETLKRMELETNTLVANCVDECIRAGLLSQMNVELLVYRVITAAHAWDLKHWRLSKIVTLDEYLSESIHATWAAFLTAKGKRRWTELRLGKNTTTKSAKSQAAPA